MSSGDPEFQSSPLTPPGFSLGGQESEHPVEQLQLARAIGGERDYLNARLAMVLQMLADRDRAIDVLSVTVNRVPTDVQQAVANLKLLIDERFKSIETQFKERDTRQEREARDNTVAVNAAFAAQKESALAQDTSNAKAIAKSEAATTESINKLGELQSTTTQALSEKVDDLKDRITTVESLRMGQQDQRVERRAISGMAGIWAGVAASLGLGALSIIILIIHYH
jgi:cation transport regulator ChaB